MTRSKEQAAKEALAAMQERYNVGLATLVELSQVRANYVDSAGGLAQARYNTVVQHLAVEFYRGKIEKAVADF